MNDIRQIISKNLATLRKEKGLTQAELAEKLNYSDKAVSRWEQGDTLPGINVLYELCEFYNITLNDLVSETCEPKEEKHRSRDSTAYRIWLCIMACASIWFAATMIFAYTMTIGGTVFWQIFVWAVPSSTLAANIMGRGHFKPIVHFILNTVIMWTFLTSVYLQLLQYNFWLIFLIGIPLQLMLFLRYKMKQFT